MPRPYRKNRGAEKLKVVGDRVTESHDQALGIWAAQLDLSRGEAIETALEGQDAYKTILVDVRSKHDAIIKQTERKPIRTDNDFYQEQASKDLHGH